MIWAARVSITHRGYVQAPAGIDANRGDTFSWPQLMVGSPQSATFHGPVVKDYLAADAYVLSSLDQLLCQGQAVLPANVNAQVRLTRDGAPNTAAAQITMDSLDILVEPQAVVPCAH